MRNILNNKNGLGIIAAIVIMLIIAVMGATAASLLGTNSQGSVNYLQSQQAFFLAESGVQKAMYELSKGGGAWTGWSGTDPKTIQLTLAGYGDYNISVASPNSSSPSITATGYVPNRNAAYKAVRVVSPTAQNNSGLFGSYAVYASGQITVNNNALIDSYNSNNGNYGGGNVSSSGNVGTNGTSSGVISVGHNGTIKGNVSTGVGGTVSNSGTVSGSQTHTNNLSYSTPVVPASLTGLTTLGALSTSNGSTVTISAGDYKYTSISLSNNSTLNITGNVNLYLTSSTTALNISNNGTLSIALGASLTVYTNGQVDFSNNGVINNLSKKAANMIIYSTYSGANGFALGNNAVAYLAVYAPNASIDLSNNAELYGSFIGNTVSLSNNGAIHLDTALQSVSPPSFMPGGGWKINSWKETY